jgi:hypothetical protein
MTAQLTLFGDPVNPTDATDKHYTDAQIAALAGQGNVRYDIAQTLTGPQKLQAQANVGMDQLIQAGTVMLFYQGAAPVGWTKLTTQNDKALRVVSGSGGVAGGTNPFSTVMAQAATGNHTLALGEMAAGVLSNATNTITVYFAGNSLLKVPTSQQTWISAHSQFDPTNTTLQPRINGPADDISGAGYASYAQNIQVQSSNTGGGAHSHPITMGIAYCDVILASKN